MSTLATIGAHQIHIDEEGFLTDADEWTEDLARSLASRVGIELTDRHWAAIRFARREYAAHHESPTIRRVATSGDIPTKVLFELFPRKPAKKLAYVAGLPKPRGCV
ncbi:MAG: TusE/DsrC/DsvC family sulfur relay protein [Nocardioides sp.]